MTSKNQTMTKQKKSLTVKKFSSSQLETYKDWEPVCRITNYAF